MFDIIILFMVIVIIAIVVIWAFMLALSDAVASIVKHDNERLTIT